RAPKKSSAAAASARAAFMKYALRRLAAATKPLSSGLAAVPIWTPSASQPNAEPRLSAGTTMPPSQDGLVHAAPGRLATTRAAGAGASERARDPEGQPVRSEANQTAEQAAEEELPEQEPPDGNHLGHSRAHVGRQRGADGSDGDDDTRRRRFRRDRGHVRDLQ